RARRCATEVRAGLEIHVRGRTTGRLAGCLDRVHLRVRAASATMMTLAYDAPVAHQHAAHGRVRWCRIDSETRQLEGPRHIRPILRLRHALLPRAGRVGARPECELQILCALRPPLPQPLDFLAEGLDVL